MYKSSVYRINCTLSLMTRCTSYNKTVPLCFLPGENIQLTIAFWRPGYCLVKPKLTRVQPWFNQTGFYGCETRVTRLYEWVKSLVNQAISGQLSKPGIILKKKKKEQWLYRGSWSFESTIICNYGRLFWRWDLGEVSAEFDCLSLFSPDLSNQKQETVTFSSQVAILFGVFHCRAIFSLPKKTFQDLLKTKLKKHRQVLFSKPGLFILGKFCPSRWEGKSKTFLYLSISSNAFEYTFCETS